MLYPISRWKMAKVSKDLNHSMLMIRTWNMSEIVAIGLITPVLGEELTAVWV